MNTEGMKAQEAVETLHNLREEMLEQSNEYTALGLAIAALQSPAGGEAVAWRWFSSRNEPMRWRDISQDRTPAGMTRDDLVAAGYRIEYATPPRVAGGVSDADVERARDAYWKAEGYTTGKGGMRAALESLAKPADRAAESGGDAYTTPAKFKNFHRMLCERFGYTHDEQFWWRDQVSLMEHIAKLATPSDGDCVRVPGWQPIATAPQDGARILAWSADLGARETHWRLYGDGSPAKANHLRGEGPSGAWDWSEPQNNWGSSWQPTHWQPLPATPTAQRQENSDG
jgi:hypothetical protein